MKFDTDIVIGLEIHAELSTNTKLFCGCSRTGSTEPNTRTCPVCLGHPGSKPVLNKKAIEHAIKLCMALDCDISKELIFSRKSYFYPDMSKNYQITQYEEPLGRNGNIIIDNKNIRINRVHMEEDPAALIHPNGMHNSSYVLVDYNRCGNPLAEIVTEPDLTSPAQARDFMKKLINILKFLEIFNLDECIIKADANISIKESRYTRVEIKNITGFKEMERALNYEILRQKECIKENKPILVQTRGWDAQKGITKLMRTKESEDDYGYILDPDLTITNITDDMLTKIKASMPELPDSKVRKYISEYKLKEEDAIVLASEKKLCDLFEEIISQGVDPVLTTRWLRRELLRVLNYNSLSIDDMNLTSVHLTDLFKLIQEKKITEKTAQKIMEEIIITPFDVREYIKINKLESVSDTKELKNICQKILDNNPQAVAEFKDGKEKALNFLVGQVMRETKGKASPKDINDLFKELIN
jgi:aspartyl-tRNA(Asn)/glutamyl-tRNA(Gln) amidotransferase subunit B